ncbi:MAG TPA: hypothetical protein VF744_04105, partial [Beijerinckiaceae bacterium]
WSLDPDTRPANLDEFVKQTTGILELPKAPDDYIKALVFVQAGKEVLMIRLPPAELVQNTLDNLNTGGKYPMPDFYEERLLNGQHQDNKEFFTFRVGDYTIAHCT